MFDEPLRITRRGRRIVLSGSLDEMTLVELRSELVRHAQPGRRLIVDLTTVTYMTSAAVGVLVKARRDSQALGRELVFVAAPDSFAARLFRSLGLPLGPWHPGPSGE